MKPTVSRPLWIALPVAVCAAAALFVGAPFLTAARFQEAALAGDFAAMEGLTDITALRADLHARMQARIIAAMHTDGELHHNPLAGLGLAIVPAMADRVVEAAATPRGLAVLVATGEAPKTPVEAAFPPPPAEREPVRRRAGYESWNTFRLTVRRTSAPEHRATRLVFTRNGTAWKLTRIEPPA
ncbi:DUF2939 domain-containing protein [Phenylobacterium sp.]|uniref:DUF2939 domain-containing protein n=1 Tax=Phenylobacterium sp. TaxID=1871053 RepID=UPI003983D81F